MATSLGVFAAFVGVGSWVTATRVEHSLERTATAALQDAGITASAQFEGRDAVLEGNVRSAAESIGADILVADLPGVRRVDTRLRVAAPTSGAAEPEESPSSPPATPSPSPGESTDNSAPEPEEAAPAPTGEPILFTISSIELTPAARLYLEKVAAYAKAAPAVTLNIAGHSDNVGPRAVNRELSAARARAVAAHLSSLGVDATRLRTEGFADTRPVASNRTASGRAQNRRVEIVFEGVQ